MFRTNHARVNLVVCLILCVSCARACVRRRMCVHAYADISASSCVVWTGDLTLGDLSKVKPELITQVSLNNWRNDVADPLDDEIKILSVSSKVVRVFFASFFYILYQTVLHCYCYPLVTAFHVRQNVHRFCHHWCHTHSRCSLPVLSLLLMSLPYFPDYKSRLFT